MNGYNFTERVRKTLALAREEAAALHHEYVGTEHLLLALVREGNGVGMSVLHNLHVDGEALRKMVLGVVKTGVPGPRAGDLPYTSRSKLVLEKSMSEARELKHSYVGTEHLLLGLLAEEKGVAAQVLIDAGVKLDHARAETMRILGPEISPPSNAGAMKHLSGSGRRIREVIAAAYDSATRRGSNELTPAHLAMALIVHDGGLANAVLERSALTSMRRSLGSMCSHRRAEPRCRAKQSFAQRL